MVTHGQTTVGTTSMSESPEPQDIQPKETPVANEAETAVEAEAPKPETAAASAAPIEIKVEPEPRPAAVPEAPARRRSLSPYAARAAALAGAVAIGWAGGHATSATRRADPAEKALLAVDW